MRKVRIVMSKNSTAADVSSFKSLRYLIVFFLLPVLHPLALEIDHIVPSSFLPRNLFVICVLPLIGFFVDRLVHLQV
jgi:hypothetical protein